ncbi:MAG: hypothetical protein EBR92_02700 [Alphaproteobacteria bacterium]|nr:hypothetical protein [Alphaproteobacteria bacterium]
MGKSGGAVYSYKPPSAVFFAFNKKSASGPYPARILTGLLSGLECRRRCGVLRRLTNTLAFANRTRIDGACP